MTQPIQNGLQLAEEHLLKGDYGSAFYHAYTTFVRSRALGHLETELDSWNLIRMIAGLVQKEFYGRAEQRDLTVTPENVLALMGEHSVHATTFYNLMQRDLKRAIEERRRGLEERLDKYWRESRNAHNQTYEEIPIDERRNYRVIDYTARIKKVNESKIKINLPSLSNELPKYPLPPPDFK